MKHILLFYLGILFSWAQSPITKSEFIYEMAPFASCHASTLAETPEGIVAAWFGGSEESKPDVGIWLSRKVGGAWTAPIEVANGLVSTKERYATWNPVLFQMPKAELILFYKVGPSPAKWWGMLKRSFDNGKTWSLAERLPEGIYGPIKNKPVLLVDGTLLCPTSSEDNGWRVHFEMTNDTGKTWTKTESINDGKEFSAIQPSILFTKDGRLQILCRSKDGYVLESFSADNGKTWSNLKSTTLPNPNSGTDALTLKDGRQLIVYNHVGKGEEFWGGSRSPLNVAISEDGKIWKPFIELENEPKMEFSYPSVIQSSDGKVHICYTWKRKKLKYLVLDVD